MITSFSRSYSFNGFTIDLDRACLLRGTDEVKLRPKVFEALRYLVENNNRLVTKEELIKAVWTDTFVTDDSLVQCLVEIRRALGDEAHCIKTVPRRGYIFEAPVTQPAADVAEVAESAKPVKSKGTPIIALLTIGGAVLASFLVFKLLTAPSPFPLTDKDTILIADFGNTTGDEIFDGTLKQALAVQLGQAPFLNIVSEERIRETLRYMNRSPEDRVTREVAREIAQRQNIKAVLAGSISRLGSHYVINLEAFNAQDGDTIGREQIEAENREQVLAKVGEAASKLRKTLGESLSSIRKYDIPIEQATTGSLEALKAFSLGREQQFSGRFFEAIPFYKRAAELDPNFAIAYAALAVALGTAQEHGLAAEYSKKAFELRDRTSEREKFYISARYYMDVLWDGDKTIEVQELWKNTYPRDFAPRTNLAVRYCAIGQFDKALAEAQESLRLNPDAGVAYSSIALSSICLNRFDDAKAAIDRAIASKLQPPQSQFMLYSIAYVKGDVAGMQQQVDRVAGTPLEAGMLSTQSVFTVASGQVVKARDLTSRAVDLALRRGSKETASQYSGADALWEAAFGNCREAKDTVSRTLALGRGRFVMTWSALAQALCGEANPAESLLAEVSRQYPSASYIKNYWAPMVHAAISLKGNDAATAIRLLQPAESGETGTNPSLWPAYIRGLAYLRQQAAKEAAAEFQKILDHKGVLAMAPSDFTPAGFSLFPLAHLGLARAAALNGDTANSQKLFNEFFNLWKDADANIPILLEAKREQVQSARPSPIRN
jgi:eukaryotic-like serine/threonine-protein kinase